MCMWFDDQNAVRRYESRIDKSGDCWRWTGASMVSGYGFMRVAGKRRYTHRMAMERALGHEIPPKRNVLHSCDNPPCVNPAHLRLGTQADNMSDCAKRARTTRGMTNRHAKLTDQEVIEIRALLAVPGRRMEDIASRYGVSRATVSFINTGKTWKHVK